jgi:hypothetical protein
MATATASILEATTSSTTRLYYRVTVKSPDGEPLAGAEVKFDLDGDGSFAPTFSAREAKPATDDAGAVNVTWYRRGIFTRTVKSTLTVSCDAPGCELTLETLDPAEMNSGPQISWVTRRRKL